MWDSSLPSLVFGITRIVLGAMQLGRPIVRDWYFHCLLNHVIKQNNNVGVEFAFFYCFPMNCEIKLVNIRWIVNGVGVWRGTLALWQFPVDSLTARWHHCDTRTTPRLPLICQLELSGVNMCVVDTVHLCLVMKAGYSYPPHLNQSPYFIGTILLFWSHPDMILEVGCCQDVKPQQTIVDGIRRIKKRQFRWTLSLLPYKLQKNN